MSGDANRELLRANDPDVYQSLLGEEERERRGIELIPSENYTYPEVLAALGSVFTNKYSEGYPGRRYYGGQEFTDQIENLARERARRLFRCEHANVQPLSGSPMNQAVYLAFMKPGDTILGMDLSHGGHLTHGAPVSHMGKIFNFVRYKTDTEDEGRIDYDGLRSGSRVPPIGSRCDQFEAALGTRVPRELPTRYEYRRAIRLIVVRPEAPNLDGELVETKRFHQERDSRVSKLLDQLRAITFGARDTEISVDAARKVVSEGLSLAAAEQRALRVEAGGFALKILMNEFETVPLDPLGILQHREHLDQTRAGQRQPESPDRQTLRATDAWQQIADGFPSNCERKSGEQAQCHPEVEERGCVEGADRRSEHQNQPRQLQRVVQLLASAAGDSAGSDESREQGDVWAQRG